MKIFKIYLAAIIVGGSIALLVPNYKAVSVASYEARQPQLKLINKDREHLGLTDLRETDSLDKTALSKCNHMTQNNYWAHDGAGRTWDSFIDGYNKKGEILARGFNTLGNQNKAWLESTHHREVIVDDYKYFGSASCNYTDGKILTVVHFGA